MEIKVKMQHISFYFFLTVFCSSSGGSQGLDASSALGRSSLKIIAIPAMCKSWHRSRRVTPVFVLASFACGTNTAVMLQSICWQATAHRHSCVLKRRHNRKLLLNMRHRIERVEDKNRLFRPMKSCPIHFIFRIHISTVITVCCACTFHDLKCLSGLMPPNADTDEQPGKFRVSSCFFFQSATERKKTSSQCNGMHLDLSSSVCPS